MVFLNLLFYLALFLVVLFFGVFIPGFVLLSFLKQKIAFWEKVVLSTSLGLVVFTLLGFLLGLCRLRLFLLPVLFLFIFYFFSHRLHQEFSGKFSKIEAWPILVVVSGALVQALFLLKSGLPFSGGLAFWGVHGYDGIWHTSLISEISRTFPPQNPGFANELLKNYHFLTDLFMAQIHQFSRIPILDLYFRFCPLFFALLLNSLVYLLAVRWTGKKGIGVLAVFFVSFAGSFGWILPFLGIGSNNWETAFWGIQTPSAFVNPPFGVSLIVLLTGLIFLDAFAKKREKMLGFLLVLCFGSLVGFKVYGALILLFSLFLFGFWEFLRRRDFSYLLVFIFSTFLSLVIYFPFNRETTGFLSFSPGWFLQTMIRAPDRVNWQLLELRRQTYAAYHDFFNLSLIWAVSFFIFLFGNLSARTLGFLVVPKILKRGSVLDKVFLIFLPLSFLPPIFFIQKAVPWNAIQFLYFFTFLFSFLAAYATWQILNFLKSKFLKIVFLLFLVAISLPSTIETLYWFNAPTPTTLLEAPEVEALAFLKKTSQKDDLILTYPYGEIQIKHFPKPPVPMTYYNSPYVAFFSERRVFLEDQNAAIILGYPLEERLAKEKEFFQTGDLLKAKKFLTQEKIAYLYLVGIQDLKADKELLGLRKVFENQKVRIFKVGEGVLQ